MDTLWCTLPLILLAVAFAAVHNRRFVRRYESSIAFGILHGRRVGREYNRHELLITAINDEDHHRRALKVLNRLVEEGYFRTEEHRNRITGQPFEKYRRTDKVWPHHGG